MSLIWLSVCLAVCLHPAPPPERAAVGVVSEWDERRAMAWAEGDPAALRALYTEGSAAGRADRAMLRAWTARGLRVEGLRMQLLSVRVVASETARLTLAVADRVAAGVVEPGGEVLPRDLVTRHRMTLRRVAGQWLVAGVRDQASPARTTSWTVGSRNS